MMSGAAEAGATAISQILLGEDFHVLDISGGWAWGYCGHDHYVGYVPAASLDVPIIPSHIVTAAIAPVFARADIKAPAVAALTTGARFVGEPLDGFIAFEGGFIHHRHARPIAGYETDPVAVAERLTGAPYLWGGRSGDGLDCSGLVQMALGLCGIEAPRDSDQQRTLGIDIAGDLRRGDLIFFPGHVGFMADAERLIHANAYWMRVVTEPLADVIGRLQNKHEQPVLARRRIA